MALRARAAASGWREILSKDQVDSIVAAHREPDGALRLPSRRSEPRLTGSSAGRCRPARGRARVGCRRRGEPGAEVALQVGACAAPGPAGGSGGGRAPPPAALRPVPAPRSGRRRGAARRSAARIALRLARASGPETTSAARRPKGGRPAVPPLGDLARVEGLAVAGDDRLHHRMLRRPGLQEGAARAARRARPGRSPAPAAGRCARRRGGRRGQGRDRRRPRRPASAAGSCGPWRPAACR